MTMNDTQKKFIIYNLSLAAIIIIGVSLGLVMSFSTIKTPTLVFVAGVYFGLIVQNYFAYRILCTMNKQKERGENDH